MNPIRLPLGALTAASCFFTVVLLAGCASTSGGPGKFESPVAASEALVAALRANDPAQLEAVLGKDGVALFDSGDEVADRSNLDAFLANYSARHDIEMDADDAILVVGPDKWPLPVPIVKLDGSWQFDVASGKTEILARRIGRNELSTLEVCRAIVDAQREYFSADRTGGGAGEYAAKFLSSEGKRDGLYWPTAEGEPESPLGPLVADAAAEGYTKDPASTERQPYHGYLYRILTSQGPNAPGGAKDYLVDGRLTGGFAVLAEPAEFGNSGVMTFLVGPDGIIYQKMLGQGTKEAAAAIQAFDPDLTWEPVED